MTVIDSLIVKLGLDSRDFQRGEKEVAAGLDKTRKSTARVGKDISASGKQAAEFFGQMERAAVKFFAVITVGRGLSDFTRTIIQGGAQLDRMSQNLGVSADKLSRWQGAVRQSGGTADAFLGSMQGLSASLTELKLTGNTGILPYLQALGVSVADANGKAKPLDQLLGDIGDRLSALPNREDAFNIGRNLGIDEGTINLLLKGRAEVERLLAAQKGYSDADAKAAREAAEQWELAKLRIERASQALVISLLPVMERLAESTAEFVETITPGLEAVTDGFAELDEATNGWASTLAIGLATLRLITGPGMIGGLGSLAAAMGKAGLLGAAGAGGYAAGSAIYENYVAPNEDLSDKIGGTIATILAGFGNEDAQRALDQHFYSLSGEPMPSPAATKPSPGISYDLANKLAEAEKANGLPPGLMASILQQETGGRQEYLNDPSKYHYERDAEGKRKSSAFGPFGILESTARDPGYGVAPLADKSLEEQIRFAAQYAAARIKSSGGVREGIGAYGEGSIYADQVLARLKDAPLTGVNAMGGGGASSSSVTIGEVKVYTQATDANGIARDIRGAMIRQADTGMR